ncbi:MAG: SpoIIE family protein phosphatase, partial [Erysipelotrichaceae bacterium]|nr:SpoIIE family protein phosphatase [Erysipelotrichaceae bacterium]
NVLKHIGTDQGLTSGAIMRIKYDEKRDIYWVVTGNSLAIMDSDYNLTTLDSFPYYNNFDLYENSLGEMWILSGNGIYVVPADEMAENACFHVRHFNASSGLPCVGTSNAYSQLMDDGTLYIAGRTTVIKVDIDAPHEDVSQLKAAIPYIEADNERIFPDDSGVFRVSSDTRKLTIYPFVYNYSLSDPLVSYYLDGFDEGDTTVKWKDLDPVSYTNLRGGDYRFVMVLKDTLGNDEAAISVNIIKEKAYYEETWFFITMAVGAFLLVAAVVSISLHFYSRIMEKRKNEEVEKERMATELKTASSIQTALLPHDFPPFPERKEFDIYASMDPAKEIGGDFYDFFFVDDDHLCLLIADVSGKGIPAALFMTSSMTVLQSLAMLGHSPAEILSSANERLCERNQAQMFVTAWLGVLEISTGKLTAANAGHEYPIIMHDRRYEILKDKHGFVLGGFSSSRYTEYELQLKPGDRIFLYTDGLTEATNAQKEMFGLERIPKVLNIDVDITVEQTIHNMKSAVNDFVKDEEQFDDLTLMCMEYKGPQE